MPNQAAMVLSFLIQGMLASGVLFMGLGSIIAALKWNGGGKSN